MKWFLFIILPLFVHSPSKGFTIQKITSKHPVQVEWKTHLLPKEALEPILNQTFSYMASGYQSYAFLSEDGDYVMKFFKQPRMELDFLERHFPFLDQFDSKRKRKYDRRRQVRHDTYSSCKLAFEELAEETQLIYIHLAKGTDLKKKVTIIDPHGKHHRLDLDTMEFVIQRRGELCIERLKKLFNQCRVDEANRLIEKVLELVKKRHEKGIVDLDLMFEKNYGCIGDEPFIIDIGSLKKWTNEDEVSALELWGRGDEISELRWQIKEWLEKEFEE